MEKLDGKSMDIVSISVETDRPTVLITAYRPDEDKWSEDFRRRKDA